ncbi:hypothetical protein NM688_g3235 [Phlebia brevispora]|uniref:Uncharacterized protein n=1 Tax=Phlebia brevispora TaxID=194682 RepID=A0ACC1T6H1_9APHY|nr:hypothetical protein NM688_g3235 [Phlebia brevispora]
MLRRIQKSTGPNKISYEERHPPFSIVLFPRFRRIKLGCSSTRYTRLSVSVLKRYASDHPLVMSLFEALTDLGPEQYPATETSKYLIRLLAGDVCTFRRNVQTSYHLVDQARIVCKDIDQLIRRFDEQEDVDAFDRYSDAIGPLQELLLSLVEITERERAVAFLPPQDSLEQCTRFIAESVEQRRKIRDALTKLRSNVEFKSLGKDTAIPEKDVKAAFRYDDLKFLSTVVNGASEYPTTKLP